MLYLIKGSRIREYHQQNVAILGALEGDQVEIGYHLRWVQPGLLPEPGTGCVLVLADSPFEEFVPVRFAKLDHVGQAGERLELRVELGPFVRPGGGPLLGELWSAREGDERPGKLFLFEDDNPGLRAPTSLAETDEGWRAAIRGLAGNGFYERSTFARILNVSDERGAPVELGDARPAHSVVQVALELVTPSAERASVPVLVDSEPPGSIEAAGWTEVPANGIATVPLKLLATGRSRAILRLLPEPLLSSRPDLILDVSEPRSPVTLVAPDADGGAAHLAPGEISRLVSRLTRDAALDAKQWLALFDDVLLRWVPDDPVLLEAYAQHAYAVGDHHAAVSRLRTVEHLSPEAVWLLLLASIRGRIPFDPELVERIEIDAEQRFADLLVALEGAGEDVWTSLLDRLPHKLLGDEKSMRFLEAAFAHVTTVAATCRVADSMGMADPHAAGRLLLGRWPSPPAPEVVVDLLVSLRHRDARMAGHLRDRVEQLAAVKRWPELLVVLGVADDLLDDDRLYPINGAGGQLLLGAVDADLRARALELLLRAANDAQRLDDLQGAIRYARVAIAEAGSQDESMYAELADALVENLEAAIRKTEVFQQWEEAQVDARSRRLQERYRGKVIHLVGARQTDWSDEIRDATGAAEVKWHEVEKQRSPTIDWSDGLRSDRDVVVVVTDHIGHDTSGAIKDRCATRGIKHIRASWGCRAVLDALDR